MIPISTRRMNDQTEAKKIKTALKQTWGTREYARVVAVNMVRVKGFAVSVVADALGVDRGTVSDWLDAYDRKGLDGLADDARPGRPPFVSREQLERIIGGAKRHRLQVRRTGREEDRREIQRAARAPSAEVARLCGQEDPPDSRPRSIPERSRNLAERHRKGGRNA